VKLYKIDLILHHEAMINFRNSCLIVTVIHIIFYFAVPGQVEDLILVPYSHVMYVKWTKPTVNSHCVTQYVIDFMPILSGNNFSYTVSGEEVEFGIEYFEECEEYEVSVRATNERDESSGAVTGNTKADSNGNYQAYYLSCL
jgi:hypothetical protein